MRRSRGGGGIRADRRGGARWRDGPTLSTRRLGGLDGSMRPLAGRLGPASTAGPGWGEGDPQPVHMGPQRGAYERAGVLADGGTRGWQVMSRWTVPDGLSRLARGDGDGAVSIPVSDPFGAAGDPEMPS